MHAYTRTYIAMHTHKHIKSRMLSLGEPFPWHSCILQCGQLLAFLALLVAGALELLRPFLDFRWQVVELGVPDVPVWDRATLSGTQTP